MSNIDLILESDCEENYTTLDLFFSCSPECQEQVTEETIRRELNKLVAIKQVPRLLS